MLSWWRPLIHRCSGCFFGDFELESVYGCARVAIFVFMVEFLLKSSQQDGVLGVTMVIGWALKAPGLKSLISQASWGRVFLFSSSFLRRDISEIGQGHKAE